MADNPALAGNVPSGARLVSITVGDIFQTDENGIFDEPEFGAWRECLVRNRYEYDPHRYMAGLTSPTGFRGQAVAFFQLANTTLLWIADWTVLKKGDIPDAPRMEQNDKDWILLKVIPEAAEIVPNGADASACTWRLSGTYVYGHRNPSNDVYNHLRFGKPPYLKEGPQRNVPTDKFRDDILADGRTSTLRTGGLF